jgi:hypothetical protein
VAAFEVHEPLLVTHPQGWKRLMTTIALDPVSKARVMYDILNEPDCRGIGWEGGGSGRSMVSRRRLCIPH